MALASPAGHVRPGGFTWSCSASAPDQQRIRSARETARQEPAQPDEPSCYCGDDEQERNVPRDHAEYQGQH
jgi:hypothetical protein